MATQRIAPPALPTAVQTYTVTDSSQFRNILRLFFNRLVDVVNTNITNIETNVRPEVITDATTARTLSESDENAVILFTSSSAITVTIAPDSDEDLEVGFLCHVYQQGTGQLSVAAGIGVTVNYSIGLDTYGQYSSLSVIKIGDDEWNLIGDQKA